MLRVLGDKCVERGDAGAHHMLHVYRGVFRRVRLAYCRSCPLHETHILLREVPRRERCQGKLNI